MFDKPISQLTLRDIGTFIFKLALALIIFAVSASIIMTAVICLLSDIK